MKRADSKRSTQQSATAVGSRQNGAQKARALMERYNQGEHLTPREAAAAVAYALANITAEQRAAMDKIAVELAVNPPAAPPKVTIEQERDILARRLKEADEVIDDAELSEIAEMLQAVHTLALEYEQQGDDGPGERAKKAAIIAGIAALGAHGSRRLMAMVEAIDGLRLYRGGEVRPKDLKELEPAAAEGGDHA